MRVLFALIVKELLVLSRDRHGLFVLFVMPAVFILIMSMALRDALDPSRLGSTTYLWLDEDRGYFALALGDALAARPRLTRLEAAGEAALLARMRADETLFAVSIAPGLSARIADAANGGKAALVRLHVSPTAPLQARLLFEAQLRAALASVQAEYLLEDQMGVPHEDAAKLRAQSDPANLVIDEVFVGANAAAAAPNAVQQSVPAWLVFAMFFVVLPLATSVLAERDQGNLQRLTLLNVSPVRLLAAKFPAYYLLNLVQLAIMLAVGVWLVPLLGGDKLTLAGSPVGLWLVASALSAAAISFGLLIAVLARSAVQATTLGGVANLVLGAIGGVMVPKLVMPPAMQAATVVSPMSWALEGCWDILLRGGGVRDVLPEVLGLAGFALAMFFAATAFFPRTER
ncbi:MAG TPA: ABC transporter permease [Verrucomicrobiae bacterium]|nr:ABC transporter permease [Verrucomicrobiae bacterium]